MIAVIAQDRAQFNKWCRKNNVKRNLGRWHIDEKGKEYIYVYRWDLVMGMEFDDYIDISHTWTDEIRKIYMLVKNRTKPFIHTVEKRD